MTLHRRILLNVYCHTFLGNTVEYFPIVYRKVWNEECYIIWTVCYRNLETSLLFNPNLAEKNRIRAFPTRISGNACNRLVWNLSLIF